MLSLMTPCIAGEERILREDDDARLTYHGNTRAKRPRTRYVGWCTRGNSAQFSHSGTKVRRQA